MRSAADQQALADIHAAFAIKVHYIGSGLVAEEIDAVFSDEPGMSYQGPGSTVRICAFEIRMEVFPERPRNKDKIVEALGEGTTWEIIDVTKRRDVDAWWCVVEEQPL